MYCKNCGAEISKESYVCPKCGVKVKEEKNIEDKPNIGLNIVSLLFPIIGIILYFVWRKETPNKAKSVLIFGLIGWGIGIVLNLLIL